MAATKLGSVFVVLGVGRHRAWIGDGEVQGAIGAAVVGGETQQPVVTSANVIRKIADESKQIQAGVRCGLICVKKGAATRWRWNGSRIAGRFSDKNGL